MVLNTDAWEHSVKKIRIPSRLAPHLEQSCNAPSGRRPCRKEEVMPLVAVRLPHFGGLQ